MKKKLFIILFIGIHLFAQNNASYFKAPFMVIQEDSLNKQIKLSFIESEYVKDDGSYCDVNKESIPEIRDKDTFSEKYCKESLSTEKIIQTIKNEVLAYPYDWETSPEKIVKLPKNYTPEEYDSYSSKGYTLTNDTIDSKYSSKIGNNKIEMLISGVGYISNGMCGDEVSVILTLKINKNLIFDDLRTNNYCAQLIGLKSIIIDFKNDTLKLDLYLEDYESSYFFVIPFSYFRNKENIFEILSEDELEKLKKFHNNMLKR